MSIQSNKTQQVKEYLLSGNQVTGLELMLDFKCLAYRNVIYRLRKQGLAIQSEMVGDKAKHAVYWIDREDIDINAGKFSTKGTLKEVINHAKK